VFEHSLKKPLSFHFDNPLIAIAQYELIDGNCQILDEQEILVNAEILRH